MQNVSIRQAQETEYALVTAFYSSVGEVVVPAKDEIILIANINQKIVGAIRLCREEGILVRRTLNVLPEHQKQGIGSRLFLAMDAIIGGETCYHLPYAHLQKYYESLGLRTISPSELPPHVHERFLTYSKSFSVIAMRSN
ncbi:MAG: hypothetical protein A2542_00440 [Parcubacteria group bacterium RIFOXYD2_FULL_52_8]|nr:MAG: hypothetical protein A2542_00440 [Parcubacteria group bacterium RIFOXYD2_FULL_52_8]